MSTHTLRDYFEHFLAYTQLCNETQEVQDKLWVAYQHGADEVGE